MTTGQGGAARGATAAGGAGGNDPWWLRHFEKIIVAEIVIGMALIYWRNGW